MKTRSIRIVALPALALLSFSLLASGCGPTKAGMKARGDASDRLNAVNAQLSYDQAKRAFEVGQFDRSLREITIAIDRRPSVAEYHLLRGRIFMETHRLERAADAFKEATKHNPSYAEAHYFLGIVYQRWSDSRRAFENYMTAFDFDSSNAQYLLAAAESMIALGEFQSARELIEPRLSYFEHNAALRHLLGQIALLENDPQKAARLYAEARLLSPDDLVLLEELAIAQFAAGMYGKSYETLRHLQASSGQPRADLLRLEARCLTHIGRLIEARNAYLELTQMEPGEVEGWIELGAVARELGDHRRVSQGGARAVALAPDRYEGYLLQAISARQNGDMKECIRLLGMAADRASDTALPHLLLGRIQENAGNVRAALAAYSSAVRAEPGHAEARAHLSRLSSAQVATVPQSE
ncbi:MAG TPA: tetratricopeptide repeat protein [Phycisphaerales bacterium]|nr:tetratricopeptide repeat protein [Phycisphaerales bacterium]HRQ76123.1 tetratricopeptide repeat protein [Phycisphaerales bacterium]